MFVTSEFGFQNLSVRGRNSSLKFVILKNALSVQYTENKLNVNFSVKWGNVYMLLV